MDNQEKHSKQPAFLADFTERIKKEKSSSENVRGRDSERSRGRTITNLVGNKVTKQLTRAKSLRRSLSRGREKLPESKPAENKPALVLV